MILWNVSCFLVKLKGQVEGKKGEEGEGVANYDSASQTFSTSVTWLTCIAKPPTLQTIKPNFPKHLSLTPLRESNLDFFCFLVYFPNFLLHSLVIRHPSHPVFRISRLKHSCHPPTRLSTSTNWIADSPSTIKLIWRRRADSSQGPMIENARLEENWFSVVCIWQKKCRFCAVGKSITPSDERKKFLGFPDWKIRAYCWCERLRNKIFHSAHVQTEKIRLGWNFSAHVLEKSKEENNGTKFYVQSWRGS